jgi:hypothetical protein
MKTLRELRYSVTILTSELVGSGQLYAPGSLILEKQPTVSTLEVLGGRQSRYERHGEKSLDIDGNLNPASPPSLPYTSRYTDWAIPTSVLY